MPKRCHPERSGFLQRSEGSASSTHTRSCQMRIPLFTQIPWKISNYRDCNHGVILSGAAWGHANLQGSWGKRSEGSASSTRGKLPNADTTVHSNPLEDFEVSRLQPRCHPERSS